MSLKNDIIEKWYFIHWETLYVPWERGQWKAGFWHCPWHISRCSVNIYSMNKLMLLLKKWALFAVFKSQLGRKFYERGFSISTIVIVKINNLTKMASRATRGSSHICALTSVQTPTGRVVRCISGRNWCRFTTLGRIHHCIPGTEHSDWHVADAPKYLICELIKRSEKIWAEKEKKRKRNFLYQQGNLAKFYCVGAAVGAQLGQPAPPLEPHPQQSSHPTSENHTTGSRVDSGCCIAPWEMQSPWVKHRTLSVLHRGLLLFLHSVVSGHLRQWCAHK